MSLFHRLKQLFSPEPDFDEIVAYQYKLPRSIIVEISKDGEHLIAILKKINDEPLSNDTVMTEAKNMLGLVAEVNDILLSYLDFPEDVKSKMPQLLPPEMELSKMISNQHKQLVFAK